MMQYIVPIGGGTEDIIAGLKKFIARCDEFETPITEIAPEEKIIKALNTAEREYGLVSLVAPNKPLNILLLNYSHKEKNSECWLMHSGEVIIGVYTPRVADPVDNVYIFAHELGHALHFALTKDVSITPPGFDKFNESLDVKVKDGDMAESFADCFALALLGHGELKQHLPKDFHHSRSCQFQRYFKSLTGKPFKLPSWMKAIAALQVRHSTK